MAIPSATSPPKLLTCTVMEVTVSGSSASWRVTSAQLVSESSHGHEEMSPRMCRSQLVSSADAMSCIGSAP